MLQVAGDTKRRDTVLAYAVQLAAATSVESPFVHLDSLQVWPTLFQSSFDANRCVCSCYNAVTGATRHGRLPLLTKWDSPWPESTLYAVVNCSLASALRYQSQAFRAQRVCSACYSHIGLIHGVHV